MTWKIDATIYGLTSSESNLEDIKYIGQTCKNVNKRVLKHIENARLGIRSHCYNWIREQLKNGHSICAVILEEKAIYSEAEKKWIAWYRELGAKLTNQTDGGDGTLGWKPSIEQIKNMRDSHIGKHEQTPARIASQKNNIKKMLSDPDRNKKISITLTGRKLSNESIEKRTITRRLNGGYVHSDEWKLQQSIRIKKSWDKRRGIINVA